MAMRMRQSPEGGGRGREWLVARQFSQNIGNALG